MEVLRDKLTVAAQRGLWKASNASLDTYRFHSEIPRLWDSVVSLACELRIPGAYYLERDTTVGLLNTNLPMAFTAPVGDEHLIAVDNSFHELIYGVAKYLILATSPVDESDPLWRSVEDDVPGRFYACARLLRLVLCGLRWYGEVAFSVHALLPTPLTLIAIDDYTEPVQRFVLAHEAGHILLDHLSSGHLTRLAVGPTDVAAIDCRHETEHEADLAAAQLLTQETLRLGASERDAPGLALESAHIVFLLLQMYTDYYFVVPPTSHPDPAARMERLVRELTPGESFAEIAARRPSFMDLPLLVALTQAMRTDNLPLDEFLAEANASNYIFSKIQPTALPLLILCEEIENEFARPPQESSLLRFFDQYAPADMMDAVPADIATRISAALAEWPQRRDPSAVGQDVGD